MRFEDVNIEEQGIELAGLLGVPPSARGMVIFAHGSGSGRLSPRNQEVAKVLNQAGLATLLFDLLTEEESEYRANIFDIPLLADRLKLATQWLHRDHRCKDLPLGYFGASTGAAAALWAAADLKKEILAVVSRGGRPDLAIPRLKEVVAPTLLLVGGDDSPVIEMNEEALKHLSSGRLVVIPGASHLFEEPGTLDAVARNAVAWFSEYLKKKARKEAA